MSRTTFDRPIGSLVSSGNRKKMSMKKVSKPPLARRVVAAVGVGALAIAAAACSNTSSGGTGTAATLNIGTLTLPSNMDPVQAGGSNLPYFQAVYDNLVNKSPGGTIEPMLATAWQWADHNRVLKLTLRQGVKFSDGTSFTAAAVKQNLIRFRDAGTSGSSLLADVKTVRVVDDSHADVVLKQPDPGFLDALWEGGGYIASPKALAHPKSLQTTPDGSGPYTLDPDKTALGTKWVYDAKSDYWGTKPSFPTITITAYTTETAMVNGLKTGQVDTTVLQQETSISSAKSDSSLTFQNYPFDVVTMAIIDTAGTIDKPLADVRVRQAMNYAINRQQMVKSILDGNGTATDEPASPDSPAYDKSLENYYPYDPAKAKQLLSEAGYPHGFSIRMPQYTPIATDAIRTAVGGYLAKVGIKVTWVPMGTDGLYSDVVVGKKYSTIIFSLGQPDDPWEQVRSVLTPLVEISPYADPVGLGLIDKIRAAKDSAAALPYYKAFNKRLTEQAVSVPFYRPDYQLVTDKSVTAVKQSGMAVPSIYNYKPAS